MDRVKILKKNDRLPRDGAPPFVCRRRDIIEPLHKIGIEFDVLITVAFADGGEIGGFCINVYGTMICLEVDSGSLLHEILPLKWYGYWYIPISRAVAQGSNSKMLQILSYASLIFRLPWIVSETAASDRCVCFATLVTSCPSHARRYFTVSGNGRPSVSRALNVLMFVKRLTMCYLIFPAAIMDVCRSVMMTPDALVSRRLSLGLFKRL